jgi:hypothetical protein
MKQGLIFTVLLLLLHGIIIAKKQASPIDIVVRSKNSNSYEVLISAKSCESISVKLINFTTQMTLREEIHNCNSLPVRKIYRIETSDRLGLGVEAQIYGKIFKKNTLLEDRKLEEIKQQAESTLFIELPAAE